MLIEGTEKYTRQQILKHLQILNNIDEKEQAIMDTLFPACLEKVEICWKAIADKYYTKNEKPYLNCNHSNQYCKLLLIFAQIISENGHNALADKFFMLNKMLNGCDIYHQVKLPESFFFNHTLGLVIGRAKLGKNLFLSQGCTIGGNAGASLEYPKLGEDNYLMANVTLIGNVQTQDRVIFSANTLVKDIEIPADSLVFSDSTGRINIKPLSNEKYRKIKSRFFTN